jgi:hypothetical protein
MYSLNCVWYTNTWNTIDELIDDYISKGILNTNIVITFNDKPTEEKISDYLPF